MAEFFASLGVCKEVRVQECRAAAALDVVNTVCGQMPRLRDQHLLEVAREALEDDNPVLLSKVAPGNTRWEKPAVFMSLILQKLAFLPFADQSDFLDKIQFPESSLGYFMDEWKDMMDHDDELEIELLEHWWFVAFDTQDYDMMYALDPDLGHAWDRDEMHISGHIDYFKRQEWDHATCHWHGFVDYVFDRRAIEVRENNEDEVRRWNTGCAWFLGLDLCGSAYECLMGTILRRHLEIASEKPMSILDEELILMIVNSKHFDLRYLRDLWSKDAKKSVANFEQDVTRLIDEAQISSATKWALRCVFPGAGQL